MAPDLIVRGLRVLTGGTVRPASVHIRGGTIVDVAGHDDVPEGCPVVDTRAGAVVMPGLCDAHVHINEPGRTEWEGFETATRAAAAGGVTSLVDMPLNSIPPTTTVAHLEEKARAAEGRCRVDVGFWGGAVPGNAGELIPLLEAGALGFKCFMVDSGVAEFGHVAEADLREALAVLAGTGAPLLVHAELPGPIDAARAAIAGLDPRTYAAYLRSRPREAEDQAIALLASLCEATGATAHVVHLSSATALDILRRARDRGAALSAETTPHYLHFTAEQIPDGATPFKCAPPIRERENREALWAALTGGLIDLVVSDHSPCTPELKQLEAGDFDAAWGGISSLQLGLSIVWTDARRRGIPLERLPDWLCRGPARLAGLRRKGEIRRGFDADLVIWDPEASFRVEPPLIEHRHKVTPYAGEELHGVVEATYLRGEKVYERGSFPGEARGRWLKREG
ncbi:allantoinase [Sorangium cellulosum]|uniref:allantoinase n=1 Tax=Sorangium cellulosum TaxID=56 RepID=A0A2L0F284_SORCE|nr:allantoinase AllB [Sorangium cellulosum]AUX45685.1 allantoinase [Sorangium cellulosum]